jgi:hypothetical protein
MKMKLHSKHLKNINNIKEDAERRYDEGEDIDSILTTIITFPKT